MFKKFIFGILLIVPMAASAMELKISTVYPDGTSEVRALRKAGREIAEATDGRVSLRIYPGGVMGDDQAVERRIRIGQLHGALVQTGALASIYKDIQIFSSPFAFRNYDEVDHIRKLFDGDLQKGLLEKQYRTFGFIEGGFAYIMSRSPIVSFEEMRQYKLWIPANDTFSERVLRSFGISPIMLNISEVLTSLQTGVIDTLIAPPAAAITLQWFSRLNYLTDAPIIYTVGTLYIHERHFARLSPEDKKTVSAILTRTVAEMDATNRRNNRAAYDALLDLNLNEIRLNEKQLKAINSNADSSNRILVNAGEYSQEWLDRLLAALKDFRKEPGNNKGDKAPSESEKLKDKSMETPDKTSEAPGQAS